MALASTDDMPFMNGAEEQSRLGRIDLQVPVHLWNDDEGCVLGVTQNLCIGGMFVATPRSLPVGARVLVRLSILDGVEPVEIEAQVCWCRRNAADQAKPAGMGLEFVDPMIRAAMFVRVLLSSRESSTV